MSKKKQTFHFKLIMSLAASILSLFVSSGAATVIKPPDGIQSYQRNVHLSPKNKEKLVADISRYRQADDLWDVLRDEFTLPHYEENPAVQEKIDWFMDNRDYLIRSAKRAAPYLYYIHQQVKKRHLPAELVLLPIIESGYNPFSRSVMGAAGIWQLMPATAADLGVRQDRWYDGRHDVVTSTRAALNHLVYLQNFFDGNWLLALAAYDTGEGNVRNAIRKNLRLGEDTDFWSLPLASEAKNYVPSLLALAVIISNPDEYPVYFPPVRNAPYLAEVEVGQEINLKLAATFAGMSHPRLLALNSGYKKKTVSRVKGAHRLILPIENVEKFTTNLSLSQLNKKMDWVHYQSKTGDTVSSVARKFKSDAPSIKHLNNISKNRIKKGSNLLIPTNKNLAHKGTPKKYALKAGDTIYMIRSNDTIDKIAKRFHVSKQSLLSTNQLRNDQVTPGKQIIIPTHQNKRIVVPVTIRS